MTGPGVGVADSNMLDFQPACPSRQALVKFTLIWWIRTKKNIYLYLKLVRFEYKHVSTAVNSITVLLSVK